MAHSSQNALVEEITLETDDRHLLGATLFSPRIREREGVVVVNPATATPQLYYRRYAEYLARSGMAVLTYDYRGVGRSRPRSLRGFAATMTDWAEHDARAALEFARTRHAGEPIALVGHSFGGQVLGLLEDAAIARGAVLVGTQLGYYGHWPLAHQPGLALLWHGIIPALTWTTGYLPGWAGLGVDLPRGVAEEWARWCRSPDFFFEHHERARERLARYSGHALLYGFSDDVYAPRGAVQAFAAAASSAKLEHRELTPAALGVREIGHFGFFRSVFCDPLWHESRDYLRAVLAGATPRATLTARQSDHCELEFTRDVLRDLEQGQA